MDVRGISVGTIILLILFSAHPAAAGDAVLSTESGLNAGPYIDRIEFEYIPSLDQRILHMQAGEIDLDLESNDLRDYIMVDPDPDMQYMDIPNDLYYKVEINCSKYPLNYTVLRRAFALGRDPAQSPLDACRRVHSSVQSRA